MSYKTILVMDEDDTPAGDLMSLPEFLDYINERMESANANPEDVFVRMSTPEYVDEDTGGDIYIGQIEFLVKE